MSFRWATLEDGTQDPWGAALVDGRVYRRGACDMKCGTPASIFTFPYLHELREELHGRLTLSACQATGILTR